MVKKNEATALATTSASDNNNGSALAAPVGDTQAQLAGLFDDTDFDFTNDGLKEVDHDDFKLPVIVYNVKGRDNNGKIRSLENFFNSLTEESFPVLHCAFIHLHKTNSFARFDNDKNANIVHCSSNDRNIGRLRTNHPDRPNLLAGTERPCEGCVDKEWYKSADGKKNVRNCDDVAGVFGYMLDDELRPTDGFLIRFKRTSLPNWRTHLSRHHLKRRRLPNGTMGNVPLYAFELNLTLKPSDNGNYAVPEFSVGRVLPKATIQHLSESAKFFAELGAEATAAAEKQEARHEAADAVGGGSGSGAPAVGANDFV